MEPRGESRQKWPSGEVPVPAWTKTIAGSAYTVKRIEGDTFGIWRDVEELGTFDVYSGAADEPQARFAGDLSLEARAVVQQFLQTSRDVPEGPATR